MNRLKRFAGLIWMLLGPAAIIFLVRTAEHEIHRHPVTDTKIQWGVFVFIFIPIAAGMVIFGYYAFRGEYDHLPENSAEIEDN